MAKVKHPLGGILAPPSVRNQWFVRFHPVLGAIAVRWPKKNTHNAPAGVQAFQIARLIQVVRSASQPNALDYASATEHAKAGDWTWRDLIVSASFGNLYQFTSQGGEQWVSWSEMAKTAQYTLDEVTTEVGDILARSSNGWIGLSPGFENYILTMIGGGPTWVAPPQSGGQTRVGPLFIGPGSSQSFTAGNLGGVLMRPQVNFTAGAIKAYVQAAVATAHVTPCIYDLAWPTVTTLIKKGPTKTGVTAGLNSWPLDAPVVLLGGHTYWVGILGRIAAFVIHGPPGEPSLTGAYNTNDTPPTNAPGMTGLTSTWGGFFLE